MSHSPTCDFVILPNNSYSATPFGLSSFYLDFKLDRINYALHQFILRFNLYNNNTSNPVQTIPMTLALDRVSLLRNANVLGQDLVDWDIHYYNLQKCCLDEGNQVFDILSLQQDSNGYLSSYPIPAGGGYYNQANIELPISLNRSYLPSSFIKNDLIIRIYIKPNIFYIGSNSDIKLDSVQLYLRTK